MSLYKNKKFTHNADRFELAYFLLGRVFDRESLLLFPTLGCYRHQCSRTKKLLEEGYIKSASFAPTRQSTRHIQNFFYLTNKGYRLLMQSADIFPDSFPKEVLEDKHMIFLSSEARASRRKNICNYNIALALAYAAGAKVHASNFYSNSGNDDAPSTDELLANAKGDDELAESDVADNDSDVKPLLIETFANTLTDDAVDDLGLFPALYKHGGLDYHSGRELKRMAGNANSSVNANDFRMGRYCGVIDSANRSMLMYVAPIYFIDWNPSYFRPELNAFMQWQRLRSPENKVEESAKLSACLVVNDYRRFARLFDNSDAKRKEKSKVGNCPFNHLYVIPKDINGAHQLRWLMLADLEAAQQEVMAGLIGEGLSVAFDEPMFPLKDAHTGAWTAICITFDMLHLYRLMEFVNKHPERNFVVVIQKWQIPYFDTKCFPENIKFLAVDDYVLDDEEAESET